MPCALSRPGPNISHFRANDVVAIGYFNAVLAPLSLISNLHLILAIHFSRAARTAENALKVNISFANLAMVGLAQIPFTLAMLDIAGSQAWYRVVALITIMESLAAVFILTLERYVGIYHPFSHYKLLQPRSLLLLILGSWLICTLLGSLTVKCSTRIIAFVIITGLKIAMALFTVFAHFRFLVTLRKIHHEVASLVRRFCNKSDDRFQSNIKGIRCTTICLLMLLLCHTPYSIVSFRFIFFNLAFENIHFFLITLAYIPAAIFPLLVIWTTRILQERILQFYSHLWSVAVSLRHVWK